MESETANNRIIYLDLLRIISAFAVVLVHTATEYWYNQPPSSFEWQVFNVYDAAGRFCLPVFVMISGVFFLNKNKEVPLKKLYGKYILRLLTAYIFWSIFYAIVRFLESGNALTAETFNGVVDSAISSCYHLWFLPMLIGVYMLVPFLRLIVKNGEQRILKYFLILFFTFGISIQTILLFNSGWPDYVSSLLTRIPVDLVCGYAGYFVMGYYVFTYDISKRLRIFSYIAGVLSIVISIIVCSYYSVSGESPSEILYGNFAITTFLASSAVFIFFKSVASRIRFSIRASKIIQVVSFCTFGIYLIHVFFLEFFDFLGFSTMSFYTVLSVPVIAVIIFGASFITIFVLRRIPKINKFIM